MDTAQAAAYRDLAGRLTQELKQALAKRDTTLLGVSQRAAGLAGLLLPVGNGGASAHAQHLGVRSGSVQRAGGDAQGTQADRDLQAGEGRRSQDPGLFGLHRHARHHVAFEGAAGAGRLQGGGTARASVDASRREDWIAEQLDRGIDVLITNPELVKPAWTCWSSRPSCSSSPGYNVYSLQQAARRSWRIGQKQPVRVIYLGYANSSQMTRLGLMARKIMVSQSTSGDVPESGLDVLNQDGDSVEVALARQLVTV